MVNPQLLDYIQKAKQAGQQDDQTRTVLYKNGWSEAEVSEAFMAISPQQPSQVSYKEPARKKGGIMPILITIIVLLVIASLVGVGVALGSRVWDPTWNPFRPSPESVILKALNNLNEIKSENFSSEISLSGEGIQASGGSSNFNVSFNTTGGVDNSDINNKLLDIQGSLTASATNTSAPEEQYNISLSGQARLIQQDLYLKLDEANLGGLESFLLMFGGPDINEVKGKWIRFQINDLSQIPQTQIIDGQQAEMEQNLKDALDKIAKILSDRKVYDISQMPDNQGTEGKEYHYYVSLSQKKVIDASPEIFGVLQEYYNKNSPETPFPYTLENFQKSINDAFDKIGKLGADLFIGKDDNFFHKIQIIKDLDISKFENSSSGIIKINYKMEEASINEPIEVSVPEGYINFKDLLSSIILKSNINQISVIAQEICSTRNSCYSLCKNGLLNGIQANYGKELIDLNDATVAQGVTKPICFAGTKDYCVSTLLTDGSWLCVGKTGILGTTKCISSKTVCQ